jgi:O-antigen/teichoic acid export membrane protein
MRVKSSIINIAAGLGNQIIITALSFISRTVFISTLGIEYLGINGLFTNILAMLALAEAGIGSSIIYNLYKPVANNDHEKINVLMKLYRSAYMIISLIVLLLGLSLMPFLGNFIKDSNVENINLIYFLFLLNTVIPYLFMHKSSFLNVNQKGYIVIGIYSISAILSTCIKIGILYFTEDYIFYLLIDTVFTTTTSIVFSIIVDKKYTFLKNKITSKLDNETKSNIVKNVKAIVLQNIGGYFAFGTESILISSFVSVAAVGIYSNYKMLIDICRTFINQIFNNVYHSVGNLVASESKDKVYGIYRVSMLLNFWLYSILTLFLYINVEPFINLWLGSEFVMSRSVLIILMIIFYERGMRNAISTVKGTSGIFHEDRFAPLCQAAVSLCTSLFLVHYYGISGVFIGSLISAIAVPFWYTPYLVYKKVFNMNVINYYKTYFHYLIIGIVTYFITSSICGLLVPDNLFNLLLRGFVCLFIPNIIYILIFHRSYEYRYLFNIVKNIIGPLVMKRKVKKKATYL